MSTLIKDLGAVSAYAYAVEKGYTGTEDEFASLMYDYTDVIQIASEARDGAVAANASAQEAKTEAQTASNTANEAANKATSKASEASASVTEAGKATNAAVAAKTAAETAQQRAETAQQASEDAQRKAELAKNEAQENATIANNKASKASQYATTATNKASEASTSAKNAKTYSEQSQASATTANTKADEASASANSAKTFADNAQQSATNAQTYMNSSSTSASKAQTNAEKTQSDKEAVESAKSDVLSAVDSAQNYANSAQSASQAIQNMDVEATTLEPDSDATVEKTVDAISGAVTLTYGIPKGQVGEKGDKGNTGDSGVYIGASAPSDENVKVWIDSDGEPDDVIQIDNTLTQSGQAADAKATGDAIVSTNERLGDLPQYPDVEQDVDFIEEIGIVNRTDLSVFSTGSTYAGRHVILPVSKGEIYKVTCISTNNTYPGCFGVVEGGTTAYIPLFLANTATYTEREVTIPDGVVTMYVNATSKNFIKIKKMGKMSQTEFEKYLFMETSPVTMKSLYDGANIFFKKKSNLNGKDLVIKMGNSSIGNNLWNFRALYYLNNTGNLSQSFTPDGSTSLSVGETDWVSPYRVSAVENADGDHPTSVFFTGGNHRSNNDSSGGGKTATQTVLTILIDGKAPIENEVTDCNCIDIYVENEINGYNTSKDDGTGRNILKEKIHFHITAEIIEVEHTIIPLEEIVVSRNYGLQVYYPGSTTRFIGGAYRKPFLTSVGKTSENKTCRNVIISNVFRIETGIYDIDTGDFAMSPYSYFTSGNKVYSNIIYDNSLVFSEGDEYYYKGYYIFD